MRSIQNFLGFAFGALTALSALHAGASAAVFNCPTCNAMATVSQTTSLANAVAQVQSSLLANNTQNRYPVAESQAQLLSEGKNATPLLYNQNYQAASAQAAQQSATFSSSFFNPYSDLNGGIDLAALQSFWSGILPEECAETLCLAGVGPNLDTSSASSAITRPSSIFPDPQDYSTTVQL